MASLRLGDAAPDFEQASSEGYKAVTPYLRLTPQPNK